MIPFADSSRLAVKFFEFAKALTRLAASLSPAEKYTFSNSTGHMAETGASASTNDKVYLNKDESTYKAQTKDTPYLIPGWLK